MTLAYRSIEHSTVNQHPSTVSDGEVEKLLLEAHGASPPVRQELLSKVIVLNLGLAGRVARQFAGRGLELDDLTQVARLALCKAADGYLPARGRSFVAYALPTMRGEVKRHFRDTAWTVRPPRRLQELRPQIASAAEVLTGNQNRAPTVAEVARALDVEPGEVIEARLSGGGYRAVSLDDLDRIDATADRYDVGYATLDDRLGLRRALVVLTERELLILRLRFIHEHSQAEIGIELGVSQMQISRLLAGILARLRELLADDAA